MRATRHDNGFRFRCSAAFLQLVERAADENDVSVSEFIRAATREAAQQAVGNRPGQAAA